MKKKQLHPAYVALVVCMSGALLMPLIPLASETVDWNLLGGAYLFSDGFESGNLSVWSSSFP